VPACQAVFLELQQKEYIRYEHLPLEAENGRRFEVEFISNVYEVDSQKVIQCNIRDITDRKRIEATLQASLAEKEILLREIHHRVKNNLQVISSMLHLQSRYIETPSYRALFEDCQGRIRSMAMIHERLYRSQNLASINFGEH